MQTTRVLPREPCVYGARVVHRGFGMLTSSEGSRDLQRDP